MKGAHKTSRRRSAAAEPVPRGRAREEALAAIAAEARARMLAAPSLLDSITPEEWEEFRASDLPEILGSGPERINPPSS